MPSLEIQPIGEADLPSVADFAHRAVHRAQGGASDSPISAGHTAAEFLAIFRWRTLNNPARPHELELGQCIRRNDGSLAGIHLVCPFRYRLGDRRLLGACSGVYFADDDARIQAFFLFRRFLALPGFDFYFANTCNVYSSQLWQKCGGRPVPDSDKQWLLPLRMGPLVREVLIRRGRKRLAPIGHAAGSLLDWFKRKLPTGNLKTEPTTDLEFMAHCAERWRLSTHLVPERDLSYMRWHYEQSPFSEPFQRNNRSAVASNASTATSRQILRFRDSSNREGWFAVNTATMGIDQNLTVATISDWSVPTISHAEPGTHRAAPPFDFSSIIRAAACALDDSVDAIVFRPRADLQLIERSLPLRQRTYPAPQHYLLAASRVKDPHWENILITSQTDAV
jgi:hypothetical protein